MDIVVKGRHLELSERFREHVREKLDKVERFDPKMIATAVEVSKESNPRLADRAYRVEITCVSRGPIIRAEASADDKYGALDLAWGKLEARLRKAKDQRRDHHRRMTAVGAGLNGEVPAAMTEPASPAESADAASTGPLEVEGDGPPVVREKWHEAAPMDLAHALEAMELVGHDFYLFVDSASGCPSVVYRRRGYDYGVIRLQMEETRVAHVR